MQFLLGFLAGFVCTTAATSVCLWYLIDHVLCSED